MKIEIEKIKITIKWWQLLVIMVVIVVVVMLFIWLMSLPLADDLRNSLQIDT